METNAPARDVIPLRNTTDAALTANGNSDGWRAFLSYASAILHLNVSAVSGTATPTLTVSIEEKDSSSGGWIKIAEFQPVTAIGEYRLCIADFGTELRAVYVISGTTPSFTFTLEAIVSTETAAGGDVKDAGVSWKTAYGIAGVTFTSADATVAAVCTSVPTTGQKLVITDLIVSVNMDCTVTFEEETTGTDKLVLYPRAGATIQFKPRSKFKLDTVDKRLTIKSSLAGAISVLVFYYSES